MTKTITSSLFSTLIFTARAIFETPQLNKRFLIPLGFTFTALLTSQALVNNELQNYISKPRTAEHHEMTIEPQQDSYLFVNVKPETKEIYSRVTNRSFANFVKESELEDKITELDGTLFWTNNYMHILSLLSKGHNPETAFEKATYISLCQFVSNSYTDGTYKPQKEIPSGSSDTLFDRINNADKETKEYEFLQLKKLIQTLNKATNEILVAYASSATQPRDATTAAINNAPGFEQANESKNLNQYSLTFILNEIDGLQHKILDHLTLNKHSNKSFSTQNCSTRE